MPVPWYSQSPSIVECEQETTIQLRLDQKKGKLKMRCDDCKEKRCTSRKTLLRSSFTTKYDAMAGLFGGVKS